MAAPRAVFESIEAIEIELRAASRFVEANKIDLTQSYRRSQTQDSQDAPKIEV